MTAEKSCDAKKPKKFISLKCEPESIKSDFEKSNLRPHIVPSNIKIQEESKVEEILKSRLRRPLRYLKDATEAEYSQHIQGYGRSLNSSVFYPVFSNQANAHKKEEDSTSFTVQLENKTSKSLDPTGHLEDSGNKRNRSLASDLRSEEKQAATGDRASAWCSVRKVSLLPLCFEDELKNPDAKIIPAPPVAASARSAPPSHGVQDDKKPIIFHDTQYVQTLLLTKNTFTEHILENEKNHPCKRTNFVLERNYEILNSLINGESVTLSKPKKAMHRAGERYLQVRSCEGGHRTTKNKPTKSKDQTLDTRPWSARHNFSQTFSSLTKKTVEYLNKTPIGESSAAAGRFRRMPSAARPTVPPRFRALSLQSHSKPLRNIFDLRKLNNATPLDDLLHFPKGN